MRNAKSKALTRQQPTKTTAARRRLKLGNFTVPTPDQIARAGGPSGAFTAMQLAEWGVPWPPPAGWRAKLEQRWYDTGGYEKSNRAVTRKSALRAIKADRPITNPNAKRKSIRFDSNGIRWPIVVTTGPLTANGLTVIELKDRAHADKLGYAWIGRPPSSR